MAASAMPPALSCACCLHGDKWLPPLLFAHAWNDAIYSDAVARAAAQPRQCGPADLGAGAAR
ncbi:unnamed protein product [Urochloa humidicola]